MNDINFKGGVFIKNPKTGDKWNDVWNVIKSELPRRKYLFEDYNGDGDKFVAFKSCYDKDMASVILRSGVKFKFYPEINLKSRLDTYFPEESRKIVDSQTNVIESEDELRKFMQESDIKPALFKKYRWVPNDHIEKTYKATGLNPDDCITEIVDGVTFIKDKSGKTLVKASPNNARGVNFVYQYPQKVASSSNKDETSRRFALTQGGETKDFGPLRVVEFFKNFRENVKIDAGRKRPQKK